MRQHLTASKPTLSRRERETFSERGWIGPFPLLSLNQVENITRIHMATVDRFTPLADMPKLTATEPFPVRPWMKSMHAYIAEYADIACAPAIVHRIVPLLGRDILAWGCSTLVRKPAQRHRWHVDVEHGSWRGVSVFLGLRGTESRSSLQVVSGSHRFHEWPQDFSEIDSIVDLVNCIDPGATVETVPLKPGEFFIFDGGLWHGSDNQTAHERYAMLIQFCSVTESVRVPLNWNRPVRWHNYRPPCIRVGGGASAGENDAYERHELPLQLP